MNLAAPPQILDHPCCDVVNELPWGFFLLVHIVLFAAGAYFAFRAFEGGPGVWDGASLCSRSPRSPT